MKKYFITGLIIFLPVIITIAVVGFIVHLLTDPFMGAVSTLLSYLHIIEDGFLFLSHEEMIRLISQLLILVFLFLITVVFGVLARALFLGSILNLGDKMLHRIPVVNTVYKTLQDIIKTLLSPDKTTLKQVVMVPFPRKDIYVLGIVVREAPPVCSKKLDEELISVLIPTAPNPTTGFLLMYKKSDLIYVDIKPEEAIKYIVSCGVIQPEARA